MLISSHLESRLNAGTTWQWQWHRLRTMRTNLAAAGFENKQIPKSSSHVLQHRLFSVDARTRRGGESKQRATHPGRLVHQAQSFGILCSFVRRGGVNAKQKPAAADASLATQSAFCDKVANSRTHSASRPVIQLFQAPNFYIY